METFSERVMRFGEEIPDKEALVFRKESVTFGALKMRVRKAAAFLAECGVKKGDRVLFSAPSKPETIVAYLAVTRIGAVAVFIDKNSTPGNALSIYSEADGVLFLTDMKLPDVPPEVKLASLKEVCGAGAKQEESDVCASCEPEDLSEILFTTGTTGKPKGVMLSHRAVLSILQHTKTGIGIRPDDRVLIPLPLHHSFSLRELRAALYGGSTVVLQNGFVFAKEIEQNLDAHGCTCMIAVPVSMELLRSQMQDRFYEIMGRFRYIEIGAGSLTVEQRKRLAKKLPDTELHNTWGSSETGGALFTDVHRAAKDPVLVTAIGKPLPDITVKVLDPDGNPIRSDAEHTGRMALSGDMVMSGYWKAEDLTKAALADGLLITSDIVYEDAEGYYHMLGRADDIINVGGEKVSPLDVENVACEFPAIRECGCIGVPDTKTHLGEVPVLFYASEEEIPEADLRSYMASHAEKYKMPAYFVRVEALPRNRMEKLDRKALKILWEEKQG